MNQNIQTFISKQQEQKFNFQKTQDILLEIHLKQTEKMERQIHEERRRRLEHTTASTERVRCIIQYHREEIKHLKTVEANEKFG